MEENRYQIGVIINDAEGFHRFDEMSAKMEGREAPMAVESGKKPEELEYPLRLILEEYGEKEIIDGILNAQEEELLPRDEREKLVREVINLIGVGFDLVVWKKDRWNLD
jgi:hypothetical protein